MSSDKENKKNKVEEPRVEYEVQKPKFKGIDRETFDFDAEFAKGLTPEEAKAESIRRIREWWENRSYFYVFGNSLSRLFSFGII